MSLVWIQQVSLWSNVQSNEWMFWVHVSGVLFKDRELCGMLKSSKIRVMARDLVSDQITMYLWECSVFAPALGYNIWIISIRCEHIWYVTHVNRCGETPNIISADPHLKGVSYICGKFDNESPDGVWSNNFQMSHTLINSLHIDWVGQYLVLSRFIKVEKTFQMRPC